MWRGSLLTGQAENAPEQLEAPLMLEDSVGAYRRVFEAARDIAAQMAIDRGQRADSYVIEQEMERLSAEILMLEPHIEGAPAK